MSPNLTPAWPTADGTRPEDLTPGSQLEARFTMWDSEQERWGVGSPGRKAGSVPCPLVRGRARPPCPGRRIVGTCPAWELASSAAGSACLVWGGRRPPQGSSVALERQQCRRQTQGETLA